MKLGLLTAAFPTLTLDEIADWASDNGFETLEVACWPAGEGAARRYAGVCHIDVDALDDAKAREIVDGLERRGLAISALAYYPNPLAADPDARAAAQDHLRTVIAAAPKLGVDTVGTFVGRDRTRNLPDSLADFRDNWPPLVAHAAEPRREDRDRELPDDLLARRVAGRRQPRLQPRDLARDVHGDPGRATSASTSTRRT